MNLVVTVGVVQVYEFHDTEDGKTYFWNATEGRRLAEARGAEFVSVSLKEMSMTQKRILELAPDLNTKRALRLPGAALLSPLLFVPHKGRHVLIDGWHRLYKAAVQGFPVLPAILLTEEEEHAIRIGGA